MSTENIYNKPCQCRSSDYWADDIPGAILLNCRLNTLIHDADTEYQIYTIAHKYSTSPVLLMLLKKIY